MPLKLARQYLRLSHNLPSAISKIQPTPQAVDNYTHLVYFATIRAVHTRRTDQLDRVRHLEPLGAIITTPAHVHSCGHPSLRAVETTGAVITLTDGYQPWSVREGASRTLLGPRAALHAV